jgi:hypothetical protein
VLSPSSCGGIGDALKHSAVKASNDRVKFQKEQV